MSSTISRRRRANLWRRSAVDLATIKSTFKSRSKWMMIEPARETNRLFDCSEIDVVIVLEKGHHAPRIASRELDDDIGTCIWRS